MRTAAFGFLIGSATLASLPASLIIQGGALAILGWAMWYLLARAIPAILKAGREERELQQELYLAAQEDDRREFRESLSAFTGSLNTLTAALIRGED